ncbi:class C sortase [Salisediminibacterium beveridgei]|uniref:Sortase A, LPXTG specific n=1 Tax=Salisediminibacterium beveridgei TaxID=632773 RepID=A0A1D7QXW8_9BACI|nr:class C sortase [Salisediminibacterium beveridgei]AOM83853.1 Sortase A, LPXTG specific [Salisediminibacterium beveridgei]
MKRKVILIVIFVAGFSIFLFPFISNWYFTNMHVTITSDYDEMISNMDTADLETERANAQAYNEQLYGMPSLLSDPFESDGTDGETGYYNLLNIGEVMGYVEIPKIDIKLPIYHGTSDDVLSQGVGHMSNTSLPVGGVGTHTVLTGHRGLPSTKMFRELDEMMEGDIFLINTLDEIMAYQVGEVKIVEPYETESLEISPDKDLATLITCDPYMLNTHRMLVIGERVPYDPYGPERAGFVPDDAGAGLNPYLIAAIVISVILATVYYLKRRKKALSALEEGGAP